MIVTGGLTLDENLKRVTPWWDLATKYLVAAMMAIALTCIVVQVTKDNVVCVPAVDCSKSTRPNGSSTVNVSDDSVKLCQSLTSKSSKKTVLAKMVDRRLYDYVDSVCFQEMSWFTKFFPLFLLVEAVCLLGLDILWTKLPFSSSVLNSFVALTEECFSSLTTMNIISKTERQGGSVDNSAGSGSVDNSAGSGSVDNSAGSSSVDNSAGSGSVDNSAIITEADVLKVLNVIEKAGDFRREHETLNNQDKSSQKSNTPDDARKRLMTQDQKKCLRRYCFYIVRTIFQIVFCIASFGTNVSDQMFYGYFGNTFQFQCGIDEFVFSKEYDHFECSHPLAPYFHIAVILFLIFLFLHLVISFFAIGTVCCYGRTYTFPSSGIGSADNDFAFLFYLLTQHDKLYADSVSRFFTTEENLRKNVSEFITKNYNRENNSSAGHSGPSPKNLSTSSARADPGGGSGGS